MVGPINLLDGSKKYLFVACDYYSKAIVMEDMNDLRSKTFIDIFRNRVLVEKSTPRVVIGDSAKQFLGNEWTGFCVVNDIEFRNSLPYHHQANGLVENRIKTIKRNLLDYIARKYEWKDLLILVKNAMNNNLVSDTTGLTPHHIETGQLWNYPLDNKLRRSLEEKQFL